MWCCRLLCIAGIAAASSGCGTDPVFCTDETVALTAVIVNGTGQPITLISVTDTVVRNGAVLDISASHPAGGLPADGASQIVVFSDDFMETILPPSELVAVAVSAGTQSVSARFEFGTDGCHVRRVAGPDTLEIPPPEPPSAHAVVQGLVTSRADRLLAGATLDLTATGQGGQPIATGSASTGADGSFSLALLAEAALPQAATLEVIVHGPPGSGFGDRTLTGYTLEFSAKNPATDTLRFTVELELVGTAGLLYEIQPCGLPPIAGPYGCPDTMEVAAGDSMLIGHAVIDTSHTHADILIRPNCAVNLEILHDGQLVGTLPSVPTCPDSVAVNGFNAPSILNVVGFRWEVPALTPATYTLRSVWLRDPLETREAVLLVR